MSRFALTALALTVLAVPPAFAQSAPPLSGARTVYVNVGSLSARRDIKAALKRELPQVRIVSHLRDADAVIQLRGTPASESPAGTTEVSVSNVTSYDGKTGATTYDTKSVTMSIGQPTHNPGHAQAFVIRGDKETLLLDGLWTPAFATQTAVRFIRAWREANDEATPKAPGERG